ncbi:PfkB family carbohydrate kinase, partial [uncultured Clostridium sp.]
CCEKIDVKNVTGAGDSFVAGIGYGYMNNLNIKDTLKYSVAMSIITITHEETINPKMSHELVKDLINRTKWREN